DLDGTLLNSSGEITDGNRRALRQARDERGVRIALVTGRRFRDARPLALDLGLDVPVISHNGALTKHARTLETVAAHLLPLPAAREVLRIGQGLNADAMVSDDPDGMGLLLYDHINDNNHALAAYIAWSRRLHGDEEAQRSIRRVPSLSDYIDHAPVHVAFSGTCTQMLEVAEALRRELAGEVRVLSTVYPKRDFALVDVLHPEASKGAGLAAVAAEYHLTPAEVMAMGDNHNDLEMLLYAGTSVVMKNAEPELREHARNFHLTLSNDEDGVAAAIEQLILNT
ncbi:MAG: HAD family phosphatase, partial [Pyrinomonadaceae bacterium]|nr:HAD family phosphatase [Pyrinomonadaceae bacterium]